MKKQLIRVFALALILLLLPSAASCTGAEQDIVREELGLIFSLPQSMTKVNAEDYDIYYEDLYTIFAASRMDEEHLLRFSLPADATARDLAYAAIDKLGITEEDSELEYHQSRNAYTYYYTYDVKEDASYFCYTTVIDGKDALWAVEMICEYRLSGDYIKVFRGWSERLMA